jgi:hypothetical protein
MYTISSAVDGLESSAASPPKEFQQMVSEDVDLHSAVSQAVSYNDDLDPNEGKPFHPRQPEVIHLNIQELVKNFRPFAPPPAPVAMDPSEKKTGRRASSKAIPKQKSFSAVLTIIEKTHADGQKNLCDT